MSNPKNFRQINEAQDLNQCNAFHTLWSRRQVDNQVSTLSNPTQVPTPSISTPPNSVDKPTEQVHKPKTLFPNRLRNNNNAQIKKIHEIFN